MAFLDWTNTAAPLLLNSPREVLWGCGYAYSQEGNEHSLLCLCSIFCMFEFGLKVIASPQEDYGVDSIFTLCGVVVLFD